MYICTPDTECDVMRKGSNADSASFPCSCNILTGTV